MKKEEKAIYDRMRSASHDAWHKKPPKVVKKEKDAAHDENNKSRRTQ
jgi:hypothetical protein